jgi:hypothetical protein
LNSFWARSTPKSLNGSTSWRERLPASSTAAYSRAVTASRKPTFQLPGSLPVTLAAPRIVVISGKSA